MGTAKGWAAATLTALAACGGGQGEVASQEESPRSPAAEQPVPVSVAPLPDAACGACRFDGSGPVLVGSTTIAASFAAAPLDGAPYQDAGGIRATGTIAFVTYDAGVFALQVGTDACARGTIDTIWSCTIENGVATVRFSGACDGGERFTAEASAPDLHVQDLARCEPEPACPEGQCPCAETAACEPCHGDGHDGPPPEGGTVPGDGTTPPPDGTSPPSDGTSPPGDGGTGGTSPPPYIPL